VVVEYFESQIAKITETIHELQKLLKQSTSTSSHVLAIHNQLR